MRRRRRTKVVATLGPASSGRIIIRRLFEAGADVFRINMSHTTHEKMRELVTTIREVEAECNRPIGILVDLQGPTGQVKQVTLDACDQSGNPVMTWSLTDAFIKSYDPGQSQAGGSAVLTETIVLGFKEAKRTK